MHFEAYKIKPTDVETTKSQQYSLYYAEPMIELAENNVIENSYNVEDDKYKAEKDVRKNNTDKRLNNNSYLFAAAYRKNTFEYKTFDDRKAPNKTTSENKDTADLKDNNKDTFNLPTTIKNALDENDIEATDIKSANVEKVTKVIPVC